MKQKALTKWFLGLLCVLGQQGVDYDLPETDPNWWGVYLWTKRN